MANPLPVRSIADVKAIQQQLGHQTATDTLNTYMHLFEGDRDASSATESRPERVLGDVVDIQFRAGTDDSQGFLGSGGGT